MGKRPFACPPIARIQSKYIFCTIWIDKRPLSPCGMGILFFACPKKRTKRKGSRATETAPVAKFRNRRCKNSLRSNSLPLHPVPDLADRLSGNGLPLTPNINLPEKQSFCGADIHYLPNFFLFLLPTLCVGTLFLRSAYPFCITGFSPATSGRFPSIWQIRPAFVGTIFCPFGTRKEGLFGAAQVKKMS